jgi:hypothetical protein
MYRPRKLVLLLALATTLSLAAACSDATSPTASNNIQPNCTSEGQGSNTHC